MKSLSRRRLLQITGGLALASAAPARAGVAIGEDWSSDVGILRRAWETLHPGLYRYATPAEVTGRLDRLATEWAAPGSFRDRFAALTRVTASIRCGHTFPSPYNASDAVVARMYPDRSLVPFRFVWINGRMVVTRDDSAGALFPRGSQITAIDGVPTSDILARLMPLARADGASDAKRVSLMEVRGDDGYETFDIHLPLILPIRDIAAFTLSDGPTVRADLLTLAERKAGAPDAGQPDGDGNPWTLERGADGIARLTMPGWALYNSDFDWEAWLGRVMDDLTGDGARGLIVDLRGNEGGEDCGNVILSRLIDRDLPLSRSQRFVRYRRAPDNLRPHLDTWDRSFLDWGDQAVGPDERGFYRLTRYDDGAETTLIQPQGPRFAGPVVVLCDASNSSATFQFAQAVKDAGLATLLGTTTGGNRRGINGGAFFFLRLPASGIEIDLPLIAGFPDTPQPDAAIEPDVFVPTTAADIAAGRDPQMAAATARILNA
ncbi:S41 family peptidase [Brevundimonas sp.]|uniref:S41 family peptidase n=1 Tax=Brevundimonas sp. TaxID=1871086 RepID=UPI003D0C816D